MKFLKLIGFGNLLLLAFSQFIFKYGFLDYQPELVLALNDGKYALLVLACISIAAGGFFINATAGIGKTPNANMSEAKIYNIYIAFNLIGLGLGYYIADYIGRPSFMGIFVVAAATMYIYANSLKQTLLIGNVLLAIISALSIVVIGIFTLYPVISSYNQSQMAIIFSLMLDYSLFAFMMVFVITLLNDIKNTDQDYNEGLNTLPIVIGKQRAAKVAFAFGIITAGLILYYINAYLKELLWAMGYILLFVLGPLVYFLINIWSAKTRKDYTILEIVLSALLFCTALSVAVITFNIKYNA